VPRKEKKKKTPRPRDGTIGSTKSKTSESRSFSVGALGESRKIIENTV